MMCTPTMYPVKQSHYDNSKAIAINHTAAGPEASTNCISKDSQFLKTTTTAFTAKNGWFR